MRLLSLLLVSFSLFLSAESFAYPLEPAGGVTVGGGLICRDYFDTSCDATGGFISLKYAGSNQPDTIITSIGYLFLLSPDMVCDRPMASAKLLSIELDIPRVMKIVFSGAPSDRFADCSPEDRINLQKMNDITAHILR